MLNAQITKKRREFTVDVSLKLHAGSSLALFGPSGAGKSTILACLAGIEQPDDGCIDLSGVRLFPPPMPLHKRPIGYLTQEPGLFPHLTVGENVCFGIPKHEKEEHLEWVTTLRDRLQLTKLWTASASLLSGGQARRVALARMLVRKPPVVLLDEPFAGLDRQLVRELIDDLVYWSRTSGFSMIAVDHQADVLKRLCPQQVIAMEHGRIVQLGSWEEIYRAPATDLLASLVASL